MLTSTEIMIAGLKMEDREYLHNNFFVRNMPRRGRSIFTKRKFEKGEYVMEYKGICKKYNESQFLSAQKLYEENGELSYCLEFNFRNEKYCIDATREYDYGFSRLVNHARNPNLKLFRPLLVDTVSFPRIAMYAASKLNEGEELFWDYFSSLDPVNCLVNKQNKIVSPDMQWMYCRRNKKGGISYNKPKKSTSDRSGMCMICFSYKKKISNHLITVHKIQPAKKRLKLINEGRMVPVPNHLKKNKRIRARRSLTCVICGHSFTHLSVHLTRTHHLSEEKKKKIVMKSREVALCKERNERKKKYQL